MTPPTLTLVPPAAPLKGAPLEAAARAEMLRALGWGTRVSAPPWREVMFLGRPKPIKIPRVPPDVIGRIKDLSKEAFAQDDVGLKALGIAEGLHAGIPTGAVPRSMGAARALRPPRDAVSGWNRRAVLIASGPAILPLLVSAGYLTPGDVEVFAATYPKELDEQREAATEASGAAGAAARRAGHRGAFPAWLDDQLATLMDEPRDTAHYQSLYEPEPQPEGPPPPGAGVGGGGQSRIANQFRPTPSPGSLP